MSDVHQQIEDIHVEADTVSVQQVNRMVNLDVVALHQLGQVHFEFVTQGFDTHDQAHAFDLGHECHAVGQFLFIFFILQAGVFDTTQ